MTNLEKYLNTWARRVDNLTEDYIHLLLAELALTTRETLGDVEHKECMSVDALVEYAGDIVAVVEKLRTIQENVKRFIDN